jgi:hypothetical protein
VMRSRAGGFRRFLGLNWGFGRRPGCLPLPLVDVLEAFAWDELALAGRAGASCGGRWVS